MAIHQIPRNVKGESRILYIFTTKSLIYTVSFGVIGIIMYFLLYGLFLKGTTIKLIIILLHGALGYGVAMIKLPDNSENKILKKIGGERLEEVLLRAIKFKLRKKRVYVYTKEENK